MCMFEIVVELETSPLRALYSFSTCCVCVCVCVCKTLRIKRRAWIERVPRRIVEFKKEEVDPGGRVV